MYTILYYNETKFSHIKLEIKKLKSGTFLFAIPFLHFILIALKYIQALQIHLVSKHYVPHKPADFRDITC